MAKERKENNKPPISPTEVSSPFAVLALASGAVAGVNHLKTEMYPSIRRKIEHTSDKTYFENKKLKALDKAIMASNEDEKKHYLKEAGKYNYATKFLPGKTKPEFLDALKAEAEIARQQELQKIDNIIRDATKKRNAAIGVGVASILGSGLSYAYQQKKQKEYLKNLIKQSSDGDITDKEMDTLKQYTAENKSSFVPATAAAMYIAGIGADKLGDKLNESYSKKESMYKKHLADVNALQKEKEKIYEKLESAKGYDAVKLRKELNNINVKLQESADKARIFASQIGMNPANFFKTHSSTLKWGSVPLALVGAYQLASKKINPYNPGLIKDPETNDKINTAAKIIEVAGGAAMLGGMYRPVLRPMFKSIGSAIKGGKNIESLDKLKKEKDIFKDMKDEDVLSSKKRNEFLESIEKGKEEAIRKAEKFKYDKDAKVAAIGSTLLSAGIVGNGITASPVDTMITAQDYVNKKRLVKQSSAESVASPAIAHVLQNLYIKGQLHSGGVYKKFSRNLMEGNEGKVSKSVLSHLGDGFIEGVLNPDANVMKNEARELGKKLKEKGVKLNNLGPEDKLFLNALSNGDYAKALDVAPHSGLAHMFFATNAAKQNAILQEGLDRAKKTLSKKDWDKISEAYKDTVMHQLSKTLNGKNPDKYSPPRKTGFLTDTYNKAFGYLGREREKGSTIGKVYDFLGKDVDDVLHLKKKTLPVEEAKKLEEKGRLPAAGLVGMVEPALAAWNIGKPMISKTNLAEKYTGLDAAQHFARGLLNDDITKVNTKTYLSDAASDYLLSPSLGMVNRMAYDEGKINHEMLKRGLTKNKLKKVIGNDTVTEYARNPWAADRNRQVKKTKQELGLENLEKRLKTFDKGLLHDYAETGKHIMGDAMKTKSIDPDKVADELAVPINKTLDKVIDKGTKELGTKDFNETEKISEVGKKYNDIISDWGAPGTVAVGLGLVSPAAYADYKQYKKKRQKHLGKTASDDNHSNGGMALGALAGGITGGIFGKLDNEKEVEKARALLGKFELLKDSDPVEAKEIFDRLKKDKTFSKIKDMPAVKKIENAINSHYNEVMHNIRKSPEAQKLREYEKQIDKFMVKDPQPEGPFKSLIIRPVMEAASYIKSRGKKNVHKELPKNLHEIKQAKKELEQKIIDRNIQIKKKLNKSFKEGELYKAHLDAQKSLGEYIKPAEGKIVGKSLAGAAAGATLAYMADKAYDKLSKIHKDGDPRNKEHYNISPYVGTGIIAGGALGLLGNRFKTKVIKDFADRTIDNDFVNPIAKIESIKNAGMFTDLENAVNAAAEESAKYTHKRKASYDKIKRALDVDTSAFNTKKAKDMFIGAGFGAVAGYSFGNNHNIRKKNEISTTNMLLKKQSSDDDYKKTDAMIYAGLVGTGAGVGSFLGHKAGKIKKAKLYPAFENIKQTSNMYVKDGEGYKHFKDFKAEYDTPQIVDSLRESLKKFKAGKNTMSKQDLNKREPILKQYKTLQNKIYDAEEKYLPREKQLTELQKLYKELAKHKESGNESEYRKVMEEIENIRAPKDKNEYSKIEQALNDFMKAKEELRNSDVVNKYKHVDFKLLHQVHRKVPEIEKELKSIPMKGAIKGGLAGTALGGAAAYLTYKDLNSNN